MKNRYLNFFRVWNVIKDLIETSRLPFGIRRTFVMAIAPVELQLNDRILRFYSDGFEKRQNNVPTVLWNLSQFPSADVHVLSVECYVVIQRNLGKVLASRCKTCLKTGEKSSWKGGYFNTRRNSSGAQR